MSYADYLPPPSNSLPKYEWNCPRQGCKKYILSYTAKGLETLKELHLDDHAKQDRENMLRFQEALKESLKKQPPRDYNTLILTWDDINFLTTRGIRIDEQIVYDSKLKPKVCLQEGLPGSIWKRILERAWPLQ